MSGPPNRHPGLSGLLGQQAIDDRFEGVIRQGSSEGLNHFDLIGILRVGESDSEGGRRRNSNSVANRQVASNFGCMLGAVQASTKFRRVQTD